MQICAGKHVLGCSSDDARSLAILFELKTTLKKMTNLQPTHFQPPAYSEPQPTLPTDSTVRLVSVNLWKLLKNKDSRQISELKS
jgi:hypothetical protein